jgi:hypothetical protein
MSLNRIEDKIRAPIALSEGLLFIARLKQLNVMSC